MNDEQIDISTWHLPAECTAYTVFTFLLYGAFDAKSVATAQWLSIWLLHYSPYEEVAEVYNSNPDLWHETKFLELLGTKEPISKFYSLTDFRTKAQTAFPPQD